MVTSWRALLELQVDGGRDGGRCATPGRAPAMSPASERQADGGASIGRSRRKSSPNGNSRSMRAQQASADERDARRRRRPGATSSHSTMCCRKTSRRLAPERAAHADLGRAGQELAEQEADQVERAHDQEEERHDHQRGRLPGHHALLVHPGEDRGHAVVERPREAADLLLLGHVARRGSPGRPRRCLRVGSSTQIWIQSVSEARQPSKPVPEAAPSRRCCPRCGSSCGAGSGRG